MSKTEELRKEADKLEAKIRAEILHFVQENGDCDVNVSTDMDRVVLPNGKAKIARVGVIVNVTI